MAERLTERVVSLPLSTDHTDEEIERGRSGGSEREQIALELRDDGLAGVLAAT